MGYRTAQAAIAAATLADADAALAYATETVYTVRQVFVSYLQVRGALGQAKADAIDAVLKTEDPNAERIFFTTGIDPNFAESIPFLAALPAATGGVVTDADCDLIRNFGRTARGPRYQADWGLLAFDADTVTNLDALATWEGNMEALRQHRPRRSRFRGPDH
jgi:hypothetical protein